MCIIASLVAPLSPIVCDFTAVVIPFTLGVNLSNETLNTPHKILTPTQIINQMLRGRRRSMSDWFPVKFCVPFMWMLVLSRGGPGHR